MLTKEQKKKVIGDAAEYIKKSQNIVFADFGGVGVEGVKKLKRELKKALPAGRQAAPVFKVTKKTLLKLAFKEIGLDFDPLQFKAQLGAVFVPGDLNSVASQIYKFSKDLAKEKKNFQILGNYDVSNKNFMTADEFLIIAKLPSREILLAQLVGVLAGPIRAFMHIVDQLSKKVPVEVSTPAGDNKTVEQTAN